MNRLFCPLCGSHAESVPWEDGLYIKECTECGHRLYKNSKPCTAAIVVDRDTRRILLTKRGITPYKGFWDLPGGFLRNGEDPVDGMKREVREELGVECSVGNIVDIVVDTYGEDDCFTFNVCYMVSLHSPDVAPADDVADAQWFGFDDLPDALAFNFLDELIDSVQNSIFSDEV